MPVKHRTSNMKNKRIWTHFNETTTMHGFRHLSESAKVRKVIWILMIVLCAAYLLYQVWKKWEDFQKKPMNTNMDIEYPTDMHFPAVAICNTNQFRISYMRNKLYHMITDLYSTGKAAVKSHNFSFYEKQMMKLEHDNSYELLKAAGPSIRDMLLVCRWPDGSECSEKDFVKLTTDFGICYAINTNAQKPVDVNRAGVESGVYMLLNIESYERMGSPTTAIGLKVLIYNQTSLPMISLHGIDLPPGFLSQLGISMQEKQKLPVSEGGTCITEDEDLTYFENLPHMYSVEKCKIDKKISMIEEKCKCLPFYVPLHNVVAQSQERNNTKKLCDIEDHFSCVVAQSVVPKAASNCKENCTTIAFKPFLSMSKLPTTSLESVIGYERNERMFEQFKHSMESRHRVQKDKLSATESVIQNMRQMDKRLQLLKYRPFKDEFRGIYQNFIQSVPCFRNVLDKYGVTLSTVDKMLKELPTRAPASIVPFGKVAKYIYPNKTTEELLQNWSDLKSEAENITFGYVEELKVTLMGILNILSFYNENGYQKELEADVHEYEQIFQAIEEFQNETITKHSWATKTLKLKHMFMQMQAVMNKILTNVQNFDRINKDEWYLKMFTRIDNETLNDTKLTLIQHHLFERIITYDSKCEKELETSMRKLGVRGYPPPPPGAPPPPFGAPPPPFGPPPPPSSSNTATGSNSQPPPEQTGDTQAPAEKPGGLPPPPGEPEPPPPTETTTETLPPPGQPGGPAPSLETTTETLLPQTTTNGPPPPPETTTETLPPPGQPGGPPPPPETTTETLPPPGQPGGPPPSLETTTEPPPPQTTTNGPPLPPETTTETLPLPGQPGGPPPSVETTTEPLPPQTTTDGPLPLSETTTQPLPPPGQPGGHPPPPGQPEPPPPMEKRKKRQAPPPPGPPPDQHKFLYPYVEMCPAVVPLDTKTMIEESMQCLKGPVSAHAAKMNKEVRDLLIEMLVPWENFINHLSLYMNELQWSNEFYEENILAVNIYYQDLSVEKFSQEWAYNKWSFACDLGGTLGLCLGASIISLFEMIDFFILRPVFDRKKEHAVNEPESKGPSVTTPEMHIPKNQIMSVDGDYLPPRPY